MVVESQNDDVRRKNEKKEKQDVLVSTSEHDKPDSSPQQQRHQDDIAQIDPLNSTQNDELPGGHQDEELPNENDDV